MATKKQKKEAAAKVAELKGNMPGGYVSGYQQQINGILKQLNDRSFSYEAGEDPLYKSYKSLYKNEGRMAMLDTQADAAAKSGGYANSYAASAGQQAYQSYLKKLPETQAGLQKAAYSRYQGEGEELQDRLSTYQSADSAAYSRYRGAVEDYWKQLNYWAGVASGRK